MTYRSIRSIFPVLVLAAWSLSSCQKVVNIDLNEASPKLVIEGVITDSIGPYTVKLTQSGSFYTPQVPVAVTGAFVSISDDIGLTDTLKELYPGLYFTSILQGVPGHTYHLKVISGNKEYDAESSMMSHVNIDSLVLETVDRLNRRYQTGTYGITCYFQDPPDEKNHYRTMMYVGDSLTNDRYRLYNDQYTNGEDINLRVGTASAGDTIRVLLYSLDQSTYDYYRTLNDILDINPFFGSTPANPNTNLSNGALGYFGAFAISRAQLIVPK